MTNEKKCTPPPSATRRVKLRFDENGNPAYHSVTSPECFKQTALGVVPPRDVIPVIFVPGIGGSLIQLIKTKEATWDPEHDPLSSAARSQRTRQRQFDPQGTEVKLDGKFSVANNMYWLTTEDAKKRGWGGLFGGYHEFLQKLETILNDQYTNPGVLPDDEAQALSWRLLEIGMTKYYGGGLTKEPERSFWRKRYWWQPDFLEEAQKTMKTWGKSPKALTEPELDKLDNYYYPVWAAPYNWLGDPEEAVKELEKQISDVIAHYEKSKYFRHQDKVILVTHSMGGLIARRTAQKDSSRILGIVHGVCPLTGAAVIYRRMRAGQEGGGIVPIVMGDSQEEMTVQLGRSPGAFILAPTKDYPKHWLKAYMADKEDEQKLIFSLPEENPYTEIYAKMADDVWWGMIEPEMLDPKGIMTGKDGKLTPRTAYDNAIEKAAKFHDTLKLFAHPETYGFYGTDSEKYRSFESVSWLLNPGYNVPHTARPISKLNADKASWKFFNDAKGSMEVTEKYSGCAFVPVPDPDKPARSTTVNNRTFYDSKDISICFKITDSRDTLGDGTVPACSGEMLYKLQPPPKEVIGFPGYDHQSAYDDKNVYRATIYFIARIVQKAEAPPMSCSK